MSKKHNHQRNYQSPRPFVAEPKPQPKPDPRPEPKPEEALTDAALDAIDAAIAAVQKLAEARAAENLSSSRAAGVKKELAELRKFLSAYAL